MCYCEACNNTCIGCFVIRTCNGRQLRCTSTGKGNGGNSKFECILTSSSQNFLVNNILHMPSVLSREHSNLVGVSTAGQRHIELTVRKHGPGQVDSHARKFGPAPY
jgi:hypothetical protein